MRRSNSTSHIPMPKGDIRSRPKSSSRTSIKDSTKKVRAASTDRLTGPPPSRSSSLSNKRSVAATPTLLGTKSYGAKKSNLVTPQMSSGLKRSNSNLATPSSSSRGRSPYKIDFSVNDKEWVVKQSRKVLTFLQYNPVCAENIAEKLRPPITINTFVLVMNILLKEIHPRCEEINTTNYKDVVMKLLKVFRYPGTVSNSLLKTVNTKHAWPQVLCIFSWLVDLITTLKRVDLPPNPAQEEDIRYKKLECVTNYVIRKYELYNQGEDQEIADLEFKEEFGNILNIDDNEVKHLQEDVTTLSQLKATQMNKITEQENKNDSIKKEIDTLQNEIDIFYSTRQEKQDNLDDNLMALKAQRDKLRLNVKAKQESIKAITDAIKKQTCTVQEKQKIVNHIEQLKRTIDLKKEKAQLKKAIRVECEAKLSAARAEIETQVYRLNNSLMKLALLRPELKVLQLKETDFLSEEFENDIQNFVKNMKMFEKKFADEIAQAKSTVLQIYSENHILGSKIESVVKKIDLLEASKKTLQKEINLYKNHMAQMSAKRGEEKKKFTEVIKDMKEKQLNLGHFQEELKKVTYQRDVDAASLEARKHEVVQFFIKLHELTVKYVGNLATIRNDIFDKLKESLTAVKENQDTILADLHKLDEILE